MALARNKIALRPIWPSVEIDPARVDVDYYPPADELTLYFGGRPVPAVSDFLTATGFEDVAILVDAETREVVGLHVILLLMGAVRDHPAWAGLAWAALSGELGEETLHAVLPEFVHAVRAAFERSWTPPPEA